MLTELGRRRSEGGNFAELTVATIVRLLQVSDEKFDKKWKAQRVLAVEFNGKIWRKMRT
jgi:hypothetical protein